MPLRSRNRQKRAGIESFAIDFHRAGRCQTKVKKFSFSAPIWIRARFDSGPFLSVSCS
jgi:hypothetical protein